MHRWILFSSFPDPLIFLHRGVCLRGCSVRFKDLAEGCVCFQVQGWLEGQNTVAASWLGSELMRDCVFYFPRPDSSTFGVLVDSGVTVPPRLCKALSINSELLASESDFKMHTDRFRAPTPTSSSMRLSHSQILLTSPHHSRGPRNYRQSGMASMPRVH